MTEYGAKRLRHGLLAVLTCLAGVAAWSPALAHAANITRVSVRSNGHQGNSDSGGGSFSADDRYVAFESAATNLVPRDTNRSVDVFVHDRQTGVTQRVSVASDGTQGNGDSGQFQLSADGRYVVFESRATNLVPGDTNGAPDIFVHDLQTGVTERVSVASDGTQGNEGSFVGSISADGRYVAFESDASNLVPGDTDGTDVFLRDRQTGTTERVSVGMGGALPNGSNDLGEISADGNYVAFYSTSSNLVPGDTNGKQDVFVWDRANGTTERVDVATDGTQANNFSEGASITSDGRYVTFDSSASNLVTGDTNGFEDSFVRDRQTGTTERISLGSGDSQLSAGGFGGAISDDGRFVTFDSSSREIDPKRVLTLFLHDRQTDATRLMSVARDGRAVRAGGAISADGRAVGFNASAGDVVPGDTNGANDVFVRLLGPAVA